MPTVLDMAAAGSGGDFGDTDGRSLSPLLGGHDPTPERLLFAESEVPFFTYGWARLRTVRQGSTKYIDAPVAELYDLDNDPDELADLASGQKDDVRHLAAEIEAWVAQGGDGGGAAPVDAETAEMLRAIGYVAGDPGRPEGEGHGNPVELIWVHEELQDIHGQMVTGAYEDALRRVRAVLEEDPENLSAMKDLSRCLINLGRLFLRRHVFVNDSDATFPRHGNGETGFSDGVHGRGYDRNIQAKPPCEPGLQRDFARQYL